MLLAVSYYLAVRLGLGFRFQHSQIGVVWPANAVMLSALLLTPKSRWWLVLLVTAAAHVAAVGGSIPAWRVAWQIGGNSLFTVGTTLLLHRFAGLPIHLESRRQVLIYTIAAFAMPALFSLTTAAFILSLLDLEPTYSAGDAFLRITLTNATGLLLVAPVVLLWARYGARRLTEQRASRLWEATAMMATLLGVGAFVFGTGPEIAQLPSLLFWMLPPLLWAAVRFGPVGASTALFTVMMLSIWGTARQMGPFVLSTEADQVLSLQIFWIVLCLPLMLLAAVIHEREQAEEALQEQRNQLAHVTRVATAGELSGALAHELRQPLMAILANAQAASRLLAHESVNIAAVREILHDIVQQDQQAASVISHLQLFLKEGEPQYETIGVESVVRDALALGRSTIDIAGVEVQPQFSAALPRVRGDAVQLLQVVLNLIVNACEAMSDAPASDRQLRLHVTQAGRHNVELKVADSGVGLPNGKTDRVFDPFFTTKPDGLGLGLAIARSITTAHGGRLWGENNPRGGATFHLELPIENNHDGNTTAHRHR
ncbi:MAG TPA: MASE1 domain-containing protein [Gemmatimonadaceae bacterium]